MNRRLENEKICQKRSLVKAKHKKANNNKVENNEKIKNNKNVALLTFSDFLTSGYLISDPITSNFVIPSFTILISVFILLYSDIFVLICSTTFVFNCFNNFVSSFSTLDFLTPRLIIPTFS